MQSEKIRKLFNKNSKSNWMCKDNIEFFLFTFKKIISHMYIFEPIVLSKYYN